MKRTITIKSTLLALIACSVAGTASAQVPHLLKDINVGAPGSDPLDNNAKFHGTTMYFRADDGINGMELWKTDGTAATTVLVKDINPGSGDSDADDIEPIGTVVYFSAEDGTNGEELWKTDGTAAGTVMVKDIRPGSTGSNASTLHNANGMLLFKANDGVHGEELWTSDGTAAGTVMIKDINPGSNDASIGTISTVGNVTYFVASDGTSGEELWKTDGTAAGTVMLKDINPGAGDAFDGGNNFAREYNGLVYFWATDGVNGMELWKTDGTAANTSMVIDINPGAANGAGQVPIIYVHNGMMYFTGVDANGAELWKSDGTAAGTTMVKDINPGSGSGYIGGFPAILNNEIYFGANDGVTGIEIWKTDGTTAGTVFVKEVVPGPTGLSFPFFLATVSSPFVFYFPANDGTSGNELWRSDGTAAGTAIVADIAPGAASGLISLNITYDIGTPLYIVANDGVSGDEPWIIDQATGIPQHLAGSQEAKIYPNPANNELNIELIKADNATAEIYNVAGQVVLSQSLQTKTTLAVSNLANGCYMIKITNGGITSFSKFVKE